MFFYLSKMIWMLVSPLTLTLILVGVGVVTRPYKWGRWMLFAGMSLFLSIGCLPIGYNLLVYLENIHAEQALPAKVDGIILLGGSVDVEDSVARHQVQLNANANRVIAFIVLSRAYPHAKLIFTGGNNALLGSSHTESEQINILLNKLNINTSRIVFENRSRTTYENMLYSKGLVHPQAGENWVLITSAYHMPRSVAVFQSNGWPVIPYQSGYFTDGNYRFMPSLDVLGGFYQFEVAAKEIMGMIAYTLTERIRLNEIQEDNTHLHTAPVPAIHTAGS